MRGFVLELDHLFEFEFEFEDDLVDTAFRVFWRLTPAHSLAPANRTMWVTLVLIMNLASAWRFRAQRPVLFWSACVLEVGNAMGTLGGLLSDPRSRQLTFVACVLTLLGMATLLERLRRRWQVEANKRRAENAQARDAFVDQLAYQTTQMLPEEAEKLLADLPDSLRGAVRLRQAALEVRNVYEGTPPRPLASARISLPAEPEGGLLWLAGLALAVPLILTGMRILRTP